MIERILPATVAVRSTRGDPSEARLRPAEEPVVAGAAEVRRREFTTTRWCARRALGDLGIAAGAILADGQGAPLWPAGAVGSLTHCTGYRAAAVARSRDVATIGIDAEPDDGLPEGVLDVVASVDEQLRLPRLPAGASWDRVLFSAKESVYKAWYPVTGRWLDHADLDVALDAGGSFAARLLVEPDPRLPERVTGRWLAAGGLVLTSVVIEA